MKTIRVSDEVWDAIAAKGKFGETEDDVLRRVFNIAAPNMRPDGATGPADATAPRTAWKKRRATDRMTQHVANGRLLLQFLSGPRKEWKLPAKEDTRGIRRVRDEAVEFVKASGGTKGQEHAAIRALTSRDYHVTKRDDTEFE